MSLLGIMTKGRRDYCQMTEATAENGGGSGGGEKEEEEEITYEPDSMFATITSSPESSSYSLWGFS